MRETDRVARRWMLVIGAFYLFMGIRLLPFINGPMIEAAGVDTIYRGGDLHVGQPAYTFVLDWMAAFGLGLIPLGAVLLVAARDPVRNRLLVYLVVGRELTAGVVADVLLIWRGDVSTGFYLGFIVLHLIVVGTGVWVLRRTAPAARLASSSDGAEGAVRQVR
jgi:hypothetical protein